MSKQNKEQEKFYAIFANNRILDARKKPTVFRYEAAGAREVKISEYVRTFIYYVPATGFFDVCEVSTGMRIAGSQVSAEVAVEEAAKWMKSADQEVFLKQVQVMGPAIRKAEMSFTSAMEYLKPLGERINGLKTESEASRVMKGK